MSLSRRTLVIGGPLVLASGRGGAGTGRGTGTGTEEEARRIAPVWTRRGFDRSRLMRRAEEPRTQAVTEGSPSRASQRIQP
jgi:hypothetical protein